MSSICYSIDACNFDNYSAVCLCNACNGTEAAEAFLKCNKVGGKVFAGLTSRRQAKRKLYMS